MTTRHRLSLFVYSFVFALLIPLISFSLWRKKRALGHPSDYEKWQRFASRLPSTKPDTWLIHCASLGEVQAAAPLLDALLAKKRRIIVSTTTAAGAQQVLRRYRGRLEHCYLPFDLGFLQRRFLRKLAPSKLIIIEVELWPNLLTQALRLAIPTTLVNGRMTSKATKRYQKFHSLYGPALAGLDHIGAQSDLDKTHYLKLGLSEEKITITGNIKFAAEKTAPLIAQVEQLKAQWKLSDISRPVWIAASTHEGEESLVLEAQQKLLTDFPDLLLILVPRHPQRFERAKQLCKDSLLTFTSASTNTAPSEDQSVYLVDKLGMLQSLYGLSQFSFIGGSITDRGGHNPLEAALFAQPVMMGKYRYNNPEICATLERAGALSSVENSDDIATQATLWLQQVTTRQLAGKQASAVCQQLHSALDNTLKLLC